MKKWLLLLFTIIILSGCSVQRVDKYHFSDIVEKIISLNINYHNVVSSGYEYYIPKGVVKTSSKSYNDILKRGDNVYYLYVDVVSYFYKSDMDFVVNKNLYYSSEIKNGNKQGYLEIEEKEDKLFIQMFYNYAKIETYVDKNDLNETISDLSYILSSIEFNDSLLKKEYASGDLSSKDEVYTLFKDKEKEGNFLEYIKEYDKYDESKNKNIEETEIKVEDKETTSKNE